MLSVLVASLAWAPRSHAHELEPALLSLSERAPGRYDAVWRVPARFGGGALTPSFPSGSERTTGRAGREGDAWVERFELRVPGGLAGRALSLQGSAARDEEALVRIESAPALVTGRLLPGGRAFVVPRLPGRLDVMRTYVTLGVEHILSGFDHLLFVFALVLLAPSFLALCGTVTAFTLAHSVTLALAALGLVSAPSAPVEASIALSIVFVGRELWQREHAGAKVSARRLWGVAFGFGLLHGLGFAGALSEIGLPDGEIPLALLSFNFGVELGQLGFVVAVRLAARLIPARALRALRAARVAPYTIGGVAAFFLFQRIAQMFA